MFKVYLYGNIGDFGGDEEHVTAKAVCDQLDAMDGDIEVRINSGGGNVVEGFAIYNALNAYKERGRVRVVIDPLAASIASYIAMAGDEIIMMENAQIMLHNPWDVGGGRKQC